MKQRYGRYDEEENEEPKRRPLGMNVVLGMIMIPKTALAFEIIFMLATWLRLTSKRWNFYTKVVKAKS